MSCLNGINNQCGGRWVTDCVCIKPPTMSQNGQVLTAVDNQYVPMPLPAAGSLFEGQMRPSDAGLSAWTFDTAMNQYPLSDNGMIFFSKIFLHEPLTATAISFLLTVDGTLMPGQNFAGIYSNTGALIVKTEDQTANWSGAQGFVYSPIPATRLAPGEYFIAFLSNGMDGYAAPFAAQHCGFGLLPISFALRALQTEMDIYTELPSQIMLDQVVSGCYYVWAGLV